MGKGQSRRILDRQTRLHNKGIRGLGSDSLERRLQLGWRVDHYCGEFQTLRAGGLLELTAERNRKGVWRIAKRNNATGRWQHIADQLHFLAGKAGPASTHARDIPGWMCKIASDDSGVDGSAGEDDRDGRSSLVGGINGGC